MNSLAPFAHLRFDRICRTPYSEAFLLSEDEVTLGRIDLHFGANVVHGMLLVERDLREDDLRELLARIDDGLVWTADRPRDDFLVTVYRGKEVGLYSDTTEDEADDDEHDEHEHEHGHR